MSNAHNITGTATIVRTTPGMIRRISVLTAGSTTGTINDCATTAAVNITNQFFTIPNIIGIYALEWPAQVGVVITPGTGQVIAVSHSS